MENVSKEDNDGDEKGQSNEREFNGVPQTQAVLSENVLPDTPQGDTTTTGSAATGEVREPVKLHPDGGWGWMVVLGSALAHFLVVGLGRSFGLFYLVLLDKFQQSSSATAWVVSLHNTFRQMLGPVAGMLCDRFTCRRVVFVGGILMCMGCVISAFASSLLYLYFSFSVLAGIGGACVFTPSYIIVGQYFEKKKGKAMGIATMGSGFGTVALAPIIAVLLRLEGYYGAMLITGALMLNNCVSGSLFRPLPQFRKKSKNVDNSHSANSDQEQNRLLTAQASTDQCKTKKCLSAKCGKNMEILKNATFILYGLQITAMSVCTMTFLTFLPGIAREYGASESQAALLLSVVGASDMVGRFLWGFFFDLKRVRHRRRLFHALLGIPMGAFALVNGAMSSYVGFVIVTILFGLVEGGFHGQRATIVSEFVDKAQMSSTVGFVIAFQGVGNLLGPPVGGLIKDHTGSYDLCYVFSGSIIILTSSIFLINYFIKDICENKQRKTEEVDVSSA